MKSNVVLIGFMGVGKTAVGRALAGLLGKEFLELDALIEQDAQKSITELFRQDGEIAFRECEIEATKKIADRKGCVIACGGGIVLNRINIDRLKQESVIILLTATPETVHRRTSNDSKRPLLNVSDRLAEIERLLKFRYPFYNTAADITIDTSTRDINAITKEIARWLEDREGFR